MGSSTSVNAEANSSSESEIIPESPKSSLLKRMSVARAKHHIAENLVNGELDRDYHEFYTTSKEDDFLLGKGNSGKVKLCIHKITGIPYALKSLSKATNKDDDIDRLRDEIKIMSVLDHPNIVRIQEYFETVEHIYLIVELSTGGDLYHRLKEKKHQHFSEQRVRELAYSLFSAVKYLHSLGIIHRDISLENIVCDNISENTNVKLIDFGMAAYVSERAMKTQSSIRDFSADSPLKREITLEGTTAVMLGRGILYAAPEVVKGDYFEMKSDVWSLGVCLYKLLTDKYPFRGEDNPTVIDDISTASIPELLDIPALHHCSAAGKAFLARCLQRDVTDRFTAAEALTDDWFSALKLTKTKSPQIETMNSLKSYPRKGSLERIGREAIAQSLPAAQLELMRDEFNKFDVNRQGTISLTDLCTSMNAVKEFAGLDLEAIFSRFQTHTPGVISYNEFVAALLPTEKISGTNLQMAFEKISGHKSKISKLDMTELLGLSASAEFNADKLWKDAGIADDQEMIFEDFQRAVLKSLAEDEDVERVARAKKSRMSTRWSGLGEF